MGIRNTETDICDTDFGKAYSRIRIYRRDLVKKKIELAFDIVENAFDKGFFAFKMFIRCGTGNIAGRSHPSKGKIRNAVFFKLFYSFIF